MYFERTEIQNFKGVEKMKLEFSSGVNLLIGNNGVGKTTVLEALALSMQNYFNRMNGITKKSIKKNDVHFTSNLVGDASQHRVYSNPTVIKSKINLDSMEYSSEISREDETNATRTKYAGKELAAAGRELLNSQTEILPVICYFSTSRVVDTQKASTSSVGTNKLNDRRCGYMDCLNATLDRKALTDWAFKMAMAEYKKGMPIAEYEAFKKAVGTFMQKMNDLDEIPLVEYTRDFEDITYTENGKTMLVNYLSAGYQSLLWMLMEISFRIALLNPEMSDYSQAEGIVFLKILYITGNDEMPFYSVDGMIPFSHVIEAPGITESSIFYLQADLEQLSTSMIDSDEIEVKAIISLNVLVLQCEKQLIISKVEEKPLDRQKIQEMPGITVYIVKTGDTLWDIAKRFYTTVEEICGLNELETDEVQPGYPLLLVKKVEN